MTFISIPLTGWGARVCIFSMPRIHSCSWRTGAQPSRVCLVSPQLAPSLTRAAYTMLICFLSLMKKASVWTDFYISCGWVPQILKFSGKTQNIWCEHCVNVYNHTVNAFYLEQKVLISFPTSGNK